MLNRRIHDPLKNAEIEIGTNRQWLETLTDEQFAEQVLDVARTVLFDFTKKNYKVTVKDQEKSFVNWLKAQTFYTKV